MKFGALFDKASELGIDHIATGHYAKVVFDEKTTPLFTLCNKKEGTEEYHLVLKYVNLWIKTAGKENTKMELYGQFIKTDCENEQKTRNNTPENKL